MYSNIDKLFSENENDEFANISY